MSYALVACVGGQPADPGARDRHHGENCSTSRLRILPAVRYGGTIASVHGLCRSLAAPRPRRARLYDQRQRRHRFAGSSRHSGGHRRREGLVLSVAAVQALYWAPSMRQQLRSHVRRVRSRAHARDVSLAAVGGGAQRACGRRALCRVAARHAGERPDRAEERALESGTDCVHRAAHVRARRGDPRHQRARGRRGRHVRIPAALRCAKFRMAPISIPKREPSRTRSARSSTARPTCCFSAASTGRRDSIDCCAAFARVDDARLVIAGNDEDQYRPALEAEGSASWGSPIASRSPDRCTAPAKPRC